MNFAENLKAIRKNHQLSQEDLAELLGVSRQAVSKWELGEGYPEVEKLLILSQKLNVSIDSLLLNGSDNATLVHGNSSRAITIISPNEGVIARTTKVMRSQPFKGGKNSPKYALFASDGNDMSFWGASNTFLAWYRNLEDITREPDTLISEPFSFFAFFAASKPTTAEPLVPAHRWTMTAAGCMVLAVWQLMWRVYRRAFR